MDKNGFPRGNPQQDCERLTAWWGEEMKKCGLAGTVTVEHAPLAGGPGAPGSGLDRFLGQTPAAAASQFRATLPGAPWPIDAVILTTADGMILQVCYHAVVKAAAPEEARMTRSIGMLSDKHEFTGAGAERFKARKEAVKRCKEALCRRYEPPLWGFHSSTKTLELKEVFVALAPEAGGCGVTLCTTVRDESAFVGKTYTLGLDKVLAALRAIEETA